MSRPPLPLRRGPAAFTLLELMVVLVVVATLLGIGLAGFTSTDQSASLRAAQSTFHSLFLAARNQAVLTQGPARLIYWVDAASGTARAVVATPGGGGWVSATAESYALPRGIFLVSSSADTLRPAGWRPRSTSILSNLAPATLTLDGLALASVWYLTFDSRGLLTTESGPFYVRIVLGVGELPPGGLPAFTMENSHRLRGFVARGSGFSVLINDAAAFDES